MPGRIIAYADGGVGAVRESSLHETALACKEQARTYEDQHDGQQQLEWLAGDPGRKPAPDEDAGDAAQQQGPGQGEVHVALRHVGYANDERENNRMCDIRADYNGRRYGIEK